MSCHQGVLFWFLTGNTVSWRRCCSLKIWKVVKGA